MLPKEAGKLMNKINTFIIFAYQYFVNVGTNYRFINVKNKNLKIYKYNKNDQNKI